MSGNRAKSDCLGAVTGKAVWGRVLEDLESQTHKFAFGVEQTQVPEVL